MSETITDGVFVRRFCVILGILAGAGFLFAVLANVITGSEHLRGKTPEQLALADRTASVFAVTTNPAKLDVGRLIKVADDGASAGKALFEGVCSGCHANPMSGAPVFGDAAAWGPRAAQGKETLHKHAIEGFNAMPPMGGSSATEAEVMAAVDYMVENSGGW